MKAIAPLLWLIPMILILIVSGTYLVGTANIFPASLTVNGQTCNVKEGTSVCPLISYYECAPATGGIESDYYTWAYDDFGFWESYKEIGICCTVYTENCQVSVTSAPLTLSGHAVQYKTDYMSTYSWLQVGSSPIVIDRNTCVDFLIYKDIDDLTQLKRTYEPWTLWSDSVSGGRVEVYDGDTWGCVLPGFTSPGTGYVTDCGDADNCNPSFIYDNKDFLDFNEAVNYLDLWVNCDNNLNYEVIESMEGYGTVYCAGDGHIYTIGSVEVKGNCYTIPTNYIGKVQCCPGSYGLCANSQACGSDGYCPTTPQPEPDCFSDFQCIGQGTWIINPSNQAQAITGKCIDGTCHVETKSIITDCQIGYRVAVDPTTGVSSCVVSDLPPDDDPIPTPDPGENEGCFAECDTQYQGLSSILDNLGCKFSNCIMPYIVMFIVAVVVAAVIVGMVGIFIPPLRWLLGNWIIGGLAVLVIAVILFTIFSIPLSWIVGAIA